MNIILFRPDEIARPLPRGDYRARHLVDTLGAQAGKQYRAGVMDGNAGMMIIDSITNSDIRFHFTPDTPAPATATATATDGVPHAAATATATDGVPHIDPRALLPLILLIGHPRPLVTKRLIADLATIGAREIHFFIAQNSEKSYLQSNIWTDGSAERMRIQGAEQAGATALSTLHRHRDLNRALQYIAAHTQTAAPHSFYLAPSHQSPAIPDFGNKDTRASNDHPFVIAIGAERGWTDSEIALLTRYRYRPRALGGRILRTATAAIAVSALVAARYSAAHRSAHS